MIIFFPFIFISWRLITLQYCSGFCHTLTWISHGFTCVSHPIPPSHLPLHLIPLGLPSASGTYTMEYYSVVKKNSFESVLMRWMKLEPIIQSVVSQKDKEQYSILTHIYRAKWLSFFWIFLKEQYFTQYSWSQISITRKYYFC